MSEVGASQPARPSRRAPAGPAAAALDAAISDADFGRFQRLIHREAGIFLSSAKKPLLVGRLAKRLRELAAGSWGDYHELVCRDPDELVQLIDRISTNETHFFREPRHFQYVGERVLPAWREEADQGRRQRTLRIWSAACSSGEEPYSAAMLALALLPPELGFRVEVLGTDISTRVLDRARGACWPMSRAAEIPKDYLQAFMLKGVGSREGILKAGPEIREVTRFERINLNGDHWPQLGQYDLVFLRNVLIYFDGETRRRVLNRVAAHVAPGGHLLLGHAETLGADVSGLRSVFPSVYRRDGADSPVSGGGR